MNTAIRRVELEDHGQDFLEFDIDAEGVIVAVRPFQEWVWKGHKVSNPDAAPGERLVFIRPNAGTSLRYPVLTNTVLDLGA